MNEQQRRSLAEQITTNPLYSEILGKMERDAIERMIAAGSEETRHEAQLAVRAVRTFRRELDRNLTSTRARKDAPA